MRLTTFLFSCFSIFKRKPLFFCLVAFCLLVPILSASAWKMSKTSKTIAPTNKGTDIQTSVSGSIEAIERLSAERVTVTPRGLEPLEIKHSAQPFLLIVDNRTGVENISFLLERVTSTQPRETAGNNAVIIRNDVSVGNGRRKWHERIQLPPGEYVLRAVNHPDWSCRITITAN